MLCYGIIYSKLNSCPYLGLRLPTFSVSFLESRETISPMPSNRQNKLYGNCHVLADPKEFIFISNYLCSESLS